METPYPKLWDPKYATLGVAVIAAAVFLLDILPRLIRTKLNKQTSPTPVSEE